MDIMRSKVIELYQNILNDSSIQLISYNQELRQAGRELDKKRPDKGHSLTKLYVIRKLFTEALIFYRHRSY